MFYDTLNMKRYMIFVGEKMDNYFEQGNFEPFVYKRLNEVIDTYKNDADSYVVFDYDNTSIIMDIEDDLNVYLMEHLAYRLTPEVLYETLTNPDYREELYQTFDRRFKNATGFNLAEDIYKEYQWLYDNYISLENRSEDLLKKIKETEHYKTFRAKLRLFHTHVNGKLSRRPSNGWMTYLFAGHTVDSFKELCRSCIEESLEKPFEKVTYESSENIPGKSGVVTSTFKSGLSVPEELLNLYRAFTNNGITTYIVSASPRVYVEVAAEMLGHSVKVDNIVAMEFEEDNGVITPVMKADSPITKGPGKTEAIQKLIMPKHNGKQPVAMFGDSIGDYDMMQTFTETPLSVIFNRHMTDDFKQLIDLAIEQYNQKDARFVLQGRDENTGVLIPSQSSISFGETEPKL